MVSSNFDSWLSQPRTHDHLPTHVSSSDLRPRPHVLSVRLDEWVVILDQRKGVYYTLNEIAAQCWTMICDGTTLEQVVNRIASEYDAPLSKIQSDIELTVSSFQNRQLVCHDLRVGSWKSPEPPSALSADVEAIRPPSIFACLILIGWFKALLLTGGFLATLEWLRRRLRPLPATLNATMDSVRSVERIVATAGAVYPGRARCLEQTLTLYYLLRRSGVAVTYCQGVQLFPFQAHAWVAYQGEVVNDVPEHTSRFVPLPAQLP